MYPDSGYKTTHAQSVCTRPFSRGEGPGDEAKLTSERDDSIPLEPANWDVLKDSYMKRSASMLDWEEEGEGDSSSLGDSPSSDCPNEEEYT